MHGLPGQSFESYLDTIRRTAELGAEHISSYALILAEGTPLFETVRNGSIELPDEDAVADMEDAGLTCSAALATSVMKYPTLPFPAANAAII